MAEGHAIVRWARGLEPLVGRALTRVDVPRRWKGLASGLLGQHVSVVKTHGKHLLVELSGGLTIHCHAMMYGSWQFGRPEMELRKPEERVRLRLRSESHEAVFFNGPIMELLTSAELASHPRISALGPDLMAADFDADEAWRRLQREPNRALGDAVLDQRIVAGIGNIYKSEGLFCASLDPRRAVSTVTREQADRIWAVTSRMMWADARRSGPIVTLDLAVQRNGDRHWVYRRRGHRCFRCSGPIDMLRQGELKRTTYFCADCQR
jgi:formamidopyrimidine-DNA glycosylase